MFYCLYFLEVNSSGSETYIIVADIGSPYTDSSFYIVPLGSWDQFKPINTSELNFAQTMDYDPVEHMVYWGDISGASGQGIYRCRVDGAHEEKVIGKLALYLSQFCSNIR